MQHEQKQAYFSNTLSWVGYGKTSNRISSASTVILDRWNEKANKFEFLHLKGSGKQRGGHLCDDKSKYVSDLFDPTFGSR